jgi:ABC-type multidrug transport system permease subunit
MKTWLVAHKYWRESWREPQVTLLFLFFPALMVLIYFFAFGQTGSGLSLFLNIVVVDQDQGGQGEQLIRWLRQAQFDGQPVFNLTQMSSAVQAEQVMAERKKSLLLVIPGGFSQALAGGQAVDLELVGDPANDNFVFASGFLDSEVDRFSRQATGWTGPELTRVEFLPSTGKMSDFQVGVPGLLVFGILFGAITSSLVLVREEVSGALGRLRLAGLPPTALLGGLCLQQGAMAGIQAVLAFLVALGFGFHAQGSLLLALAVCVVVSLTATALGLLTACFSHSDGQAAAISTILILPFAFLSGAVFPLPGIPLGMLGGHPVSAADIFSTTLAAEALRRVLIFGEGMVQVSYELGGLLLLTGLYFSLGAWLYGRMKLGS